MSVIDARAAEAVECQSAEAATPLVESWPGKKVELGRIPVMRTLPLRQRRMVGPWCFVDRFGPIAEDHPMDVAPHPHIGLQTVTWLLDGEIRHDDSLGCQTVTRPGGVSVMTAGQGIAHSEHTPDENTHRLDGVQLWVALPDGDRGRSPAFAAVPEVPLLETPGGLVRVFSGSLLGAASAAPHHSPILGADIELHSRGTVEVPLDPGWEHALIVLSGEVRAGDSALPDAQLHYLGTQRRSLELRTTKGGRALLLGGPPFPEKILMWWNFVARTSEEIAAARQDWLEHRRFGEVAAYRGKRLEAPELIGFRRA